MGTGYSYANEIPDAVLPKRTRKNLCRVVGTNETFRAAEKDVLAVLQSYANQRREPIMSKILIVNRTSSCLEYVTSHSFDYGYFFTDPEWAFGNKYHPPGSTKTIKGIPPNAVGGILGTKTKILAKGIVLTVVFNIEIKNRSYQIHCSICDPYMNNCSSTSVGIKINTEDNLGETHKDGGTDGRHAMMGTPKTDDTLPYHKYFNKKKRAGLEDKYSVLSSSKPVSVSCRFTDDLYDGISYFASQKDNTFIFTVHGNERDAEAEAESEGDVTDADDNSVSSDED